MVHQRKYFRTYHYFASKLIGVKPQLSSLNAFGTDGEEALANSFDIGFKQANSLRCKRHSRQNISHELEEMQMSKEQKENIMKDIYGYRLADTFNDWLIDSQDSSELYNVLEHIYHK